VGTPQGLDNDHDEGAPMGIFSSFAKAGLAKKAINVARKPKNQAKAKGALSSARGKGAGRRAAAGGGRATTRRSGAPRR
jgi:hypothetical protein